MPERKFNDEFDYPGTEEEEQWASQFTCDHCGPASYRMVTTAKTCLRCHDKRCPKGRQCAGQSLVRGPPDS